MDVINELVRYVVKARYIDLSPLVVDVVKRSVLDTLGAMLAGSSAEGCGEVVGLVKEWGGKKESSIIGFGGKVPAPNAALANATMARARDIDDVHHGRGGGGGHLSATTVPAAFAVAERMARPVNGKEFMLAVTLGSDLHCRMRMAMKSYGGWTSVTFAPFGVVAAGGKLMGFDEQHLLHGMGIAYAQCGGNQQANVDGALTVRLQQGLGAKAGMLALALAERGITGARNILQGKYGFYPLYTKANGDMALLTGGLGRRFEVENISLKAYPCCAYTHEPIEGMLQLMKENSLEAGDIAEIVVCANSKAYSLCVYSEEGDTKYLPRNTVDAQFSIPYTVAAAAVRRSVGLGDFSEEAIRDADVLRLARRVKVEVDPELDKIPGSVVPNVIEIRMGDGRKYTRRVEFAKGHPRNPMTMIECAEKFRECARFAVRRLPDRNIERVIDMARRLEEIEDVTEVVRLLVPGRRSA